MRVLPCLKEVWRAAWPALAAHWGPGALANLVHCGLRAQEWRQMLDAHVFEPFFACVDQRRFGLRVRLPSPARPLAFWEVRQNRNRRARKQRSYVGLL